MVAAPSPGGQRILIMVIIALLHDILAGEVDFK